MSQWIRARDMVPENNRPVLVGWGRDGLNPIVACYEPDRFRWYALPSTPIQEPFFWLRIPEMPNGSEAA